MTLQALRDTVGDAAFFAILRTWAHDKRDGNGTTAEFIALAERISGRPLTALFQQWLFTTTKPPLPPAPGIAAARGDGRGRRRGAVRAGLARRAAPATRRPRALRAGPRSVRPVTGAIVVGGGVGGLATAVVLGRAGHTVTVLERDPLPADADPEAAFRSERTGAPQAHQTHGFLARIVVELREHLPDVLDALMAAGGYTLSGAASLGEPQPGDDDLAVLIVRRTTFEWVLRQAALAEPGVTIRTGAPVVGLTAAPPRATTSRPSTGVPLEDGSDAAGDLVVAAMGRARPIPDWLAEHGVTITETVHESGLMYLTRWYHLAPEAREALDPKLGGDLTFVKYLGVPGDGDTLSITLAIRPDDTELRKALTDPDGFEHACRLLPGPDQFFRDGPLEPISGVRPMGGLLNRIRRFTDDRGRSPRAGFVAVGDAHTCTNPLYGRGCSLALVQAIRLGSALAAHPDDLVAVGRDYEAASVARGRAVVRVRGADGPHGCGPRRDPRRVGRRRCRGQGDGRGVRRRRDRSDHRPRPDAALEPARLQRGPHGRPGVPRPGDGGHGRSRGVPDPPARGPRPAGAAGRAGRGGGVTVTPGRSTPAAPACTSPRPARARSWCSPTASRTCSYSWRHQIEPLVAAGYRVIAPDQRGYGRSSAPDAVEDYDIHALTGDLVAILDDAGEEQAVFVGHDWGAIVVWNLAVLHPERVRGVVGMSVPFIPRPPMPPIAMLRAALLGDSFFYMVYFQEPGVADAELGGDPGADDATPARRGHDVRRRRTTRSELPRERRARDSSTGSPSPTACPTGSPRPSSTTTSPSSPAPATPARSTGTATWTTTGRPPKRSPTRTSGCRRSSSAVSRDPVLVMTPPGRRRRVPRRPPRRRASSTVPATGSTRSSRSR